MATPSDRGMWLYPRALEAPYRINPPAAEVVSYVSAWNAAAPTAAIKHVYAGFTVGATQDDVWLNWARQLKVGLRQLNADPNQKIKLYAASGDPAWAEAGNTQSNPNWMVASNWCNRVLQPKGPLEIGQGNFWRLFDGAMLDVEPNFLFAAGTPTQQQLLNWIIMMQQCQTMVNSAACNPGGSASARIMCALQYWLNEPRFNVTGQGQLDRLLMTKTHSTLIMSYRDTPGPSAGANGSIISISQAAAASALATGIPIRLSAEIDNTGTPYVDYAGQSRAQMVSHADQVMAYFAGNAKVTGFDFHHYAALKAMAA